MANKWVNAFEDLFINRFNGIKTKLERKFYNPKFNEAGDSFSFSHRNGEEVTFRVTPSSLSYKDQKLYGGSNEVTIYHDNGQCYKTTQLTVNNEVLNEPKVTVYNPISGKFE